MYVCTSRLGMLIFCMWRALEIRRVHTAAPLLSVGLSAQVIEYDGSICTTRTMDNTLPRMKAIVCSGNQRTMFSLESLHIETHHNVLTVCPGRPTVQNLG